VPDLYHIKRSTLLKSPPSTRTEICGTYTDLDSAQAAALRRLSDEGFARETWAEYAENDLTLPEGKVDGWAYSPNIVVHARTGGGGGAVGEVHTVEIESTPNSLGVRAKHDGDGRVSDQLCYVLREIECEDGVASVEITGIHLSRQAALTAARRELLGEDRGREFYREYREQEVGGRGGRGFGGGDDDDDDAEGPVVVVTAVGPDGERYVVSVTHES